MRSIRATVAVVTFLAGLAACASEPKQPAPGAANAVCAPTASENDCESPASSATGALSARWTEGGVLLRWRVDPAENRAGFRVLRQRSTEKGLTDPMLLTPRGIPVQDSPLSGEYEYLDRAKVGPGSMTYYVQQVDRAGSKETLDTVTIMIPNLTRRRGAGARSAKEPE